MTATWTALILACASAATVFGQAKDTVGPRPPDELKKGAGGKGEADPVEPSGEPPLTVAQIVTLLKAGAPIEQLARDIRAAGGRYRIGEEHMAQLKAAGAPPSILQLLTVERAEPLSVEEAIAIGKMPISDAEREKLIRYRPLGFPLDDFAVMRRLATSDAGNILLMLKRRRDAGKKAEPAGLPTARAEEPANPAVVIRDHTFEVGAGNTVMFTFTLENQLAHGVKNLRIRAEYLTKFQAEKRVSPVEESDDLGALEPFERRRWRSVRLHRGDAPLQFLDVKLNIRWDRDDAPPKRYAKFTMRDVDRAVGIYDPVGFLDIQPGPEWQHRFTLINRGRFAVKDVSVLLRIYDASDRPIWYHEHAVAGVLNPGDIRRESTGAVSLSGLWDRDRRPPRWLGPEPAKADLVLLRAVPADEPDGPRTLDTVVGLDVLQAQCSWIGAENPAAELHFFNFTVVNRHPFPVKDVVLLARFRDGAGVPVNYESVIVVPGVVRAHEARRFRRMTENRHLGLITESDRAGAFEISVLSATPAKGLLP